jgi:hypothetical protein
MIVIFACAVCVCVCGPDVALGEQQCLQCLQQATSLANDRVANCKWSSVEALIPWTIVWLMGVGVVDGEGGGGEQGGGSVLFVCHPKLCPRCTVPCVWPASHHFPAPLPPPPKAPHSAPAAPMAPLSMAAPWATSAPASVGEPAFTCTCAASKWVGGDMYDSISSLGKDTSDRMRSGAYHFYNLQNFIKSVLIQE